MLFIVAFFSMYISHCVPAYLLVVPPSSMNENRNIKSLLSNYPSTESEHFKRQGSGGKEKEIKS